MKNFGEVPASELIVMSSISDTKPGKSSAHEGSRRMALANFVLDPCFLEWKRYWVFIENESYRIMEGTSNLFEFIYFSYFSTEWIRVDK
jgi:hypothetical protein